MSQFVAEGARASAICLTEAQRCECQRRASARLSESKSLFASKTLSASFAFAALDGTMRSILNHRLGQPRVRRQSLVERQRTTDSWRRRGSNGDWHVPTCSDHAQRLSSA